MALIELIDGFFYEANITNSGTGNYDTFLRVQHKGDEDGFNTDENGILDNVGGIFTHSLQFADIATVLLPGDESGTEYVQFRLDLNENRNDPNILLTEFKLWVSGAPAVGSNYVGSGNFGSGFELAFDLSDAIILTSNPGSGYDEYTFYLDVTLIEQAIVAAGLTVGEAFVTLYSSFTGSEDGFEEWRVLTNETGGGTGEPVPVITIDKSGPAVIDEGGDTATYTFVITASSANAATDPLTIDSVIDNVFGNLTALALAANGGEPIVLAPGASFTFSFNSPIINIDAGLTHTNIVTVTAHDNENVVVTDTDDHVITAQDVDPVIDIVKSGPATIAEGGADVTWSFTITNNSVSTDPITVTALNDDRLGDLLAAAVAANNGNPIVLQPGGTFSFNYNPAGDLVLDAGETHTNIVTVTGVDDEGTEDSGTDDHTITATDVAPVIDIVKSGPATIAEGGADVTWSFTITNNSVSTDPITVTALNDDRLGDLLAAAVAANNGNPIVLQPGGTFSFNYNPAGDLVLDAGETHTNIVTVTGVDDEGTEDSGTDDHTITATDLLPSIDIVKSTTTTSINEGTATDIVYTYAVTNTSTASTDPLTIDSLIDDKIPGPLTYVSGDAGVLGVLDQGETWYYTATAEDVILNAGNLTNIVTVIAHDDENNSVTDDATATVKVNDLLPSIDIVKTVDANNDGIFNDSETVAAGPRVVTYRYAVTNESGVTDPLTLLGLADDKITNLGVDLTTPSSGDLDGDHIFDSGETWVFDVTTVITVAPNGSVLTNTGSVTAADDEGNSVFDTDTASVVSFSGPGVRTPGFWGNLGLQFWDGKAGFTKTGPFFPDHELAPIGPAASTYLIVGGDHDNLLEAGEIQISLKDALTMINASNKLQQDGRWMLARDAIAAELNMRAGNPGGDGVHTPSPQHLLDDAVAWLMQTTNGDQTLSVTELSSGAIKTNSSAWQSLFGTVDHSASVLHTQLDGYNNNGTVFGWQFASDGDFTV